MLTSFCCLGLELSVHASTLFPTFQTFIKNTFIKSAGISMFQKYVLSRSGTLPSMSWTSFHLWGCICLLRSLLEGPWICCPFVWNASPIGLYFLSIMQMSRLRTIFPDSLQTLVGAPSMSSPSPLAHLYCNIYLFPCLPTNCKIIERGNSIFQV